MTQCRLRLSLLCGAAVVLAAATVPPSASASSLPAGFVLTDPGSVVYYRFAAVAGDELLAVGAEVSGDVHSNGDLDLQPGTSVDGNVSASGRLRIHGEVSGVAGSAPAEDLPTLDEPGLREAAGRILPGGTVLTDAVIDDVVLVEGNLIIQGSLRGGGTLVALGDIRFVPAPQAGLVAARSDAETALSILASGDVHLDPGRSLRGVIYAGRDLLGGKRLTVDGVLLAGRRLQLLPGSAIRFIDFDVQAPQIAFASPDAGAVLPTARPVIGVSIAEELSGIREGSVRLELDGVDRTEETTTAGTDRELRLEFQPSQDLEDGLHRVLAVAADRSDNDATAERSFLTDTTPPSLAVTAPLEGAVMEALTAIEASFSDAVSGVALPTFEVVLDGVVRTASCALDAVSAVCPVDGIGVGPHQLSVAVEDRAGNGASVSRSFELVSGAVPPPPVVDPPASPTASPLVTLTGRATTGSVIEIVGGLDPVTARTAPDGRFSAEVQLALNVLNRLFVTALSDERRSPPTPVQILQDTEPPDLAIDFPLDGAELVEDQIQVVGRVGDRLSGFLGLDVSVEGQPAEVVVGVGTNGTFELGSVPLAPGPNVLEVVATDRLGNRRRREVQVHRIDPTGPRLFAVSGNGQRGVVGEALPEPLLVRMIEDDGTPVVGKVVTFEVVRSDGRVRLPGSGEAGALRLQALTDAFGEASVEWRLGGDAGCGNQRVVVRSSGIAGAPMFLASADPGPPQFLHLGSGNGQIGEVGATLPEPLRVWVDDGRNGIPGLAVTFRVTVGGGLVDGKSEITVVTDITGHAQVGLTLGPEAQEQRVEATFPGHEEQPVTFVARGVARVPGAPTSLAGLVVDNAGRPLGGATCRLEAGGSELAPVSTDREGRFRFPEATAGPAHLRVDGGTVSTVGGAPVVPGGFPKLAYEVVLVPGAANALPTPVRLPPLAVENGRLYDGTSDVVLSIAGIEGLEMTIKAGSMRLPDGSLPSPGAPVRVSLDPVHFDDLPMPMPDGAAPPVAWTLQPAGATFDPPVAVRLPNMAGLPAGATVYIVSFDHDIGRFGIVATGRVSDDGSELVSDPGSGIHKAGWGGFCPPYPNTGNIKVDSLEEAKEALRKDVAAREGTASVALARQILCLAERACSEEARESWASGFVPEVLQEIAENRANGESPADHVCRAIPSWVDLGLEVAPRPGLPPEASTDFKIGVNEACALAGGFYHFKDELLPGFERHMKSQLDTGASKEGIRSQHEGLLDQVGSCFSTIPELSPLAQFAAGKVVPIVARHFREATLGKLCQLPTGQLGLTSEARSVDLEELFVPEFALLSELHVSAPDEAFALPVGSQVQLRVLTDDGVDLAKDPATEFFLAVADGNLLLSSDGRLSVLGAPSPQAGVAAPFQVYVHNGDLFGIGQFAVVDADTDGDLAVDSAEIEAGLDPLVANGPDDDRDGDGLDDVTELLFGTNPHRADTDGDGLSDFEEVELGSDPSDPNSNTAVLGAGGEVDVAGQTALTRGDGSFQLRNLPVDLNPVRVVARMERGGEVLYGVSGFVDIEDQKTLRLPEILLTPAPPRIPVSLAVRPAQRVLNAVGATTQLTTEALLSDGSVVEVTERAQGTAYRSSNPDVATADIGGVVTAHARGRIFLTAYNQGAVAVTELLVVPGDPLTEVIGFVVFDDGTPAADVEVSLPGQSRRIRTGPDGRFSLTGVATQAGEVSLVAATQDAATGDLLLATAIDLDLVPGGLTDAGILVFAPPSRNDVDGDGAPDALELYLGLDRNDPDTANNGVLDGRVDSDGDSVPDWIEVVLGTDPTLRDSDGDGIPDDREDLDGDGFSDAFEVASRCDWRGRESTTVEGRILAGDGSPVPQAQVELFRTAGVDAPDLEVLSTETGPDGRYRFAEVSLCPLRAQVRAARDTGAGASRRVGSPRIDVAVGGVTRMPDLLLRSLPEPAYPGRREIVGDGPRGIAVGDLDLNGRPDIVTANTSAGDLSVLLGRSTARFDPQRRVAVGLRPHAVALGDLNGDGFPDAVVTDESAGVVSLLFGSGDGGFREQTGLDAGDEPVAVVLADLDGDGRSDIVTANRGSSVRPFTDGDLSVYLGRGDGTFAERVPIAVGMRPTAVAVADVDADAVVDLVAVNGSSRDLSLVFGRGDGTFEPEVRLATGGSPTGVTVADLNGDGHLDLVVSDAASDEVELLAGQGGRAFLETRRLAVGEFPLSPRVVDVTGDGVADLLTINSFSNDISLLRGTGKGDFEPPARFQTGPGPVDWAIADLGGDGDLDLATVNVASGDVSIVEFEGSGFLAPASHPVGGSPRRVSLADLNEDGVPDAVTANLFSETLSVLLGSEPGTFGAPQLVESPGFPADLSLGDVNRDGHVDVATADLTLNAASIREGTGDGGFLLTEKVSTGQLPVSVKLIDLDGDGRLDLLTADSSSSTITLAHGDGEGGFGDPESFPVGSFPLELSVADLDGDGELDVATNNFNSGSISLLLSGQGFERRRALLTAPSPLGLTAGDVDADGRADLIVSEQGLGRAVWILLNRGDASFEAVPRLREDRFAAPGYVATGDVNRDGVADLLVLDEIRSALGVHLGIGHGLFAPEIRYGVGDFPQGLALLDLNGDGAPDVVVADSETADLTVLLSAAAAAP